MRAVRLALIGVGDVAQRDYLPEFGRIADRATITVMCGRAESRVKEVAELHGVERWSTDYRDVVSDPAVDAVLNLTPIGEHFEITKAALDAGKHVYSEKPVALSPSDGTTLAQEASRRDLIFVAAPPVLLYPQVAYARDLVQSGALGRVVSACAHAFGGVPPWEGYRSDPSPFFSAAGGPLLDMAVYPLHALTGLLGPVRRVAAMSARTRAGFTIPDGPYAARSVPVVSDDLWQLLLEFDGCVASLEANFATIESLAPECELRCEGGGVAFSLLDVSAPVSEWREGDGGWTAVDVPHARLAGPDHILGVEHMVDCILGGAAPIVSAEHAIHVLSVIESARTAALGQVVTVPSSSWDPRIEAPSAGVRGAD